MLVVLAGGRAERMGGAKPGLELAGRPLIEHPLAAGRAAGLECAVAAKPATALPPLAAAVVREPPQPSHPLVGILAGLEEAAARGFSAIVAVGCDMPFVTPAALAFLAAVDGAAAVEVDGVVQPLLARWPVSARPFLAGALQSGLSLRRVLEDLGPRVIAEGELARYGDPRRMSFNVNTSSDLRAAESLLQASGEPTVAPATRSPEAR
jgi:molybdopterin-guanine dinucleotide biosynthesis protein A